MPVFQNNKMQCSNTRQYFSWEYLILDKSAVLFSIAEEKILFVLREKVQSSFGNSHLGIKLQIERIN